MTIMQEIKKLETERESVRLNKFSNPEILAVYDRSIEKLKARLKNEPSVSEKKNESESIPNDASAIAANAEPQLSQQKSSVERDNSNLALENSPVSGIDADFKKWIGLVHQEKFKNKAAYSLFIKAKNRLKTVLTNWLKSKRKRDGLAKKNETIDLCKEMTRLVNEDATVQGRAELLKMVFLITHEGKQYFYGCDAKLLNDFFKD